MRLFVTRMFTKLTTNDNNKKKGLVKKETCKVFKGTHLIYKTPFLKEFWIQFSRRLKNYMHEICQDFQKADNKGAEAKNIF